MYRVRTRLARSWARLLRSRLGVALRGWTSGWAGLSGWAGPSSLGFRRRHRLGSQWRRSRWWVLERVGPQVLGGVLLASLAAGGVATARMAVQARAPRQEFAVVPDPLPALPPLPSRFDGMALNQYLPEPTDPLLQSSVLRDEEFARAVHAWVDYWTGPAQPWFPGFLERMALRGPGVDSVLAEAGLPPSLRYLPLIESGYDPTVTSRARAVGMWQLMEGTAGDLGLEVGPIVDERRDPERSTGAALRYIRGLHENFGSWFMVLAAYNSGGARVRGILRTQAPGAPLTDSLFWALREHFPAETRDFVPKLYAAMWVASRPEAYGYAQPVIEPLRVELVRVRHRTTLDVVALAAGVPYADVVGLNPQFLRGFTPGGQHAAVRLPKGRARTFHRIYPRIRPEDRVRFIEHEVLRGETLSGIAARYGVASDELRAENPRLRAEDLGVGVRLTVPVAPPASPEQ